MIYGLTLLFLTVAILVIVYLFKRSKEVSQGWKLRTIGDHKIAYSEIVEANWESISFRIERYAKDVPRHIIYLPENWETYPIWAQQNRKTITNRLKLSYPYPEYTFKETSEIDLDTLTED